MRGKLTTLVGVRTLMGMRYCRLNPSLLFFLLLPLACGGLSGTESEPAASLADVDARAPVGGEAQSAPTGEASRGGSGGSEPGASVGGGRTADPQGGAGGGTEEGAPDESPSENEPGVETPIPQEASSEGETVTSGGNTSGGNAAQLEADASVASPSEPGLVWQAGEPILDGQPFVIRGVAWNPVVKGGTHPDGIDFRGTVAEDTELMRAAGINVVRTYVALTDTSVLDQLYAAGIYVINGVYQYGGSPAAEAVDLVNSTKDHPAILMWSIGNEWNYNGLYVDMSFEESQARLNEVAELIRSVDEHHPIACIYGEVPSAETVAAMPLVDVWGINAYRGLSFGDGLFEDYRNNSSKPMFLSEYGADAYDATQGAPNLAAQAEAVYELTQEILEQRDRGVLGGTVFEWSDEWWKDSEGSPDTQDTGGIAPGGGPHPDQTFNEEWWGIVDIDRTPRPAYAELKRLFVGE